MTFRYRDSATRRWKSCTLPTQELIRRFSCSTSCLKAFRRFAIPASSVPANATGSNRRGNYSVQPSRHSQPTWLNASPIARHPWTRSSSLVRPAVGPALDPNPASSTLPLPLAAQTRLNCIGLPSQAVSRSLTVNRPVWPVAGKSGLSCRYFPLSPGLNSVFSLIFPAHPLFSLTHFGYNGGS